MTDTYQSTAPAEAPPVAAQVDTTPAPAAQPAAPEINPLRAAAQQLAAARRQKQTEASPTAANDAVRQAMAEKSSAQADDGAQPQADPAEQTTAPDPAEPPPIEPPRSWTKEDKEVFATLPRETQEKLATRDRARETEFRRSQNEAAEARKAIDAQRTQVEQARSQYEQALPILLENLQAGYGNEFSDIRTMDDVQKLAVSDPIRYTQWDASQKRMAAVQQEVQASQQRQVAERNHHINEYRTREAALFAEKAPEFADPVQSKKLMDAAVTTLRDVGFQDQELGELYRGEKDISIHDHRFALLLRDGIKWRDAQAQAKLKTSQAKPLPPVQRPGTTRLAANPAAAEVQTLKAKFAQTHSVKDAAVLLQAERRAASRG